MGKTLDVSIELKPFAFDEPNKGTISIIELFTTYEAKPSRSGLQSQIEFTVLKVKFGGKELNECEDFSDKDYPELWNKLFNPVQKTKGTHKSIFINLDWKKANSVKSALTSSLKKEIETMITTSSKLKGYELGTVTIK